jgi:hypothetical protein
MLMRTYPFLTSLAATVVVLASNVAAHAADVVPPSSDSLSWPSLLEKAGTVGVLVWMVVWFQKRMEAKDGVVQTLTENALTAIHKLADSQVEMAKSLDKLSEAIRNK